MFHHHDNDQSNTTTSPHKLKHPISFFSIQNKKADRTFYIRDLEKRLQQFIVRSADELYHALITTFSMDQVKLSDFEKYIWPVISSGGALIIGELITTGLSTALPQNKEYEVLFKFALGAAILTYSAANRLTDCKSHNLTQLSAEITGEVLAIIYLYTSTFRGSQLLLQDKLPAAYSLVTSLGLSSLAIPGTLTHIAQKIQEKLIKREYELGAQRSDTAIMPCGLTPVSNTYFQANHFILSELLRVSRLFQLGLISDNVLHASGLLQQFRNLPALSADAAPPVLKNLIIQQAKISADYDYNTSKQKVLRTTKKVPEFLYVERYQLRNGDLVACDENFDFDAVPVSGEVVSFALDADHHPTKVLAAKKIRTNLKAYNGEDTWIEHTTSTMLSALEEKIDLHKIHQGKQAGILAGAKLDINGGENFYIRIKDQTERTFSSNYVKESVINQIVADHKRRQVIYSIVVATCIGALQTENIANIPVHALRVLFNLTQMMIPFAETFLREMVNGRLMKDINAKLTDNSMETIDALRVIDFFNALSGYYHNRFAQGVAIISDKTGTLTTSKMKVLGCWLPEMEQDVQSYLSEDSVLLPNERDKQLLCCEVFAEAFTNSKKELELEEFAILQMFSDHFHDNHYLRIEILGNNHFRKKITLDHKEKIVETRHLGLFRSLGGRLTLVEEGSDKYVIFCGIPKADSFHDMSLLALYSAMKMRTSVLSRDWCIAKASLTNKQFSDIKNLFNLGKVSEIEYLLCSKPEILEKFEHIGTFLINNPVKKGVENFISACRQIHVPVFIATGDTAKSSENIARVLCRDDIQQIITIRQSDALIWHDRAFPQHATIIFSGINEAILAIFQRILAIDIQLRPIVIFSEMTTENKGVLAQYLKNHEYFIVANGDGTNDVAMMRNANMVIAHVTDDGGYAPGVEQFANLSDKQLQLLFDSHHSFYELFDIHKKEHSLLIKKFAALANSQEKPCIGLGLKSVKMGFELARTLKMDVSDIIGLHWFGVGFDLAWLWLVFDAINATIDLPMDNLNLDESHFSTRCMVFASTIAVLQAFITYATSGESTNLTFMMVTLAFLPLILRSIFSGYGEAQQELLHNELSNEAQVTEVFDNNSLLSDIPNDLVPQSTKTKNMSSAISTYTTSVFHNDKNNNKLDSEKKQNEYSVKLK